MTAEKKVEVNLEGVTSRVEMHDRLATAFGFPEYYGKNWDAFWDCITTLEQVPKRISINGMYRLEATLPREVAKFRKALEDFRETPEAAGVILEAE